MEKNYAGINQKILEKFVEDLFPFHFQSQYLNLAEFYKKLLNGIPLQYIAHQAFFYNSFFFVDENVLIPRMETELLVHEVLLACKYKKNVTLLDLGTGSGAIVLSLLIELNIPTSAIASDISRNALNVCETNFKKLNYKIAKDKLLQLRESDRFLKIDEKFDVIVSNPPYIKRNSDILLVHEKTLKHEPNLALFLDDSTYLDWFDELFKKVDKHLNPNGLFIMEGHENHWKELTIIVKKYFSNYKIINDLTGRPRFLKVEKNG